MVLKLTRCIKLNKNKKSLKPSLYTGWRLQPLMLLYANNLDVNFAV